MIYITIALQCEARSLIQQFDLCKNEAENKYPTYNNSETTLIVTGTGKIRSAIATSHLLSCQDGGKLSESVIVNFGCCGAVRLQAVQFSDGLESVARKSGTIFRKSQGDQYSKDFTAIGDLVLVNQIRDNSSNRTYYPDMLLKHDFKEAGLETFDSAVDDITKPSLPLVDMEASGFFEAASDYFSPDRIMCVKLVSDFLEPRKLSSKRVAMLIESSINNLTLLIRAFHKIAPPVNKVLKPDDEMILNELASRFRFTSTQRHLLMKSAVSYVVRTDTTLKSLEQFFNCEPNSKRDVKRIFNTLRDYLDQS